MPSKNYRYYLLGHGLVVSTARCGFMRRVTRAQSRRSKYNTRGIGAKFGRKSDYWRQSHLGVFRRSLLRALSIENGGLSVELFGQFEQHS